MLQNAGVLRTKPSKQLCKSRQPLMCPGPRLLRGVPHPRMVSKVLVASDIINIVTEYPIISTIGISAVGYVVLGTLSAAFSPAAKAPTQMTAAEALSALEAGSACLVDIRTKEVAKEEGLVDLPKQSLYKLPYSTVSSGSPTCTISNKNLHNRHCCIVPWCIGTSMVSQI